MLKRFVVSFFLGAVILAGMITAPSFSQDWQTLDSDTSLAHFPDKILNDLPQLLTPDNLVFLSVGGVLTAADWVFFDPSNPWPPGFKALNVQPIWDFGDFYGEGWVEGFGVLGGWAGGYLIKDQKLQEFGRDAGESLLLATVMVTGLKYAVGRERPDGSNNQSFPSGHSITAFCFAPVVTKYWGLGAGIAAYSLATVTAFARVEGYHHYLSDVIAGATLGIVIGNSVVYTPKDVSVGLGLGQAELKLAFN